MQLNDNGEVIWETPHPSVTNWVRTGIYQHLMANMKILSEDKDGDVRSVDSSINVNIP